MKNNKKKGIIFTWISFHYWQDSLWSYKILKNYFFSGYFDYLFPQHLIYPFPRLFWIHMIHSYLVLFKHGIIREKLDLSVRQEKAKHARKRCISKFQFLKRLLKVFFFFFVFPFIWCLGEKLKLLSLLFTKPILPSYPWLSCSIDYWEVADEILDVDCCCTHNYNKFKWKFITGRFRFLYLLFYVFFFSFSSVPFQLGQSKEIWSAKNSWTQPFRRVRYFW